MITSDPIPPEDLRDLLAAMDVTQFEFATMLGVHLRTLQRYLAGDIPLTGSAAVATRMIARGNHE